MSNNARSWHWVAKSAVVASVALNVVFVTRALLPPEPGEINSLGTVPMAMMLENVAAKLPPADASLLRAALADHRSSIYASQARYRTSVLRVLALIASEPFDAVKTREAIEDARSARHQTGGEIIGSLLEALPEMSPEGRRALAETGWRTRQDVP